MRFGIWIILVAMSLIAILTVTAGNPLQPKQGSDEDDADIVRLQQHAAELPIRGVAPELHESVWLNTEIPLKLQNLRGKVVLVDMWTFG